jgi:predicted RNase H-like HicB family nuclease
MLYPVVIHQEGDSAFGVTVPDIPGCFSAGDTLEAAMLNTHEAIAGHLEILAEDGAVIPQAESMAIHRDKPEYADGLWALVEVDITPFLGKAEKINITLPRLLIHQIDKLVERDPRYKSRSGLLAQGAQQLLQRD